jgi:hypothetical protein
LAPCTAFAAVHESAFGTQLPIANATACPQLAKADMQPEKGKLGYAPSATLAAKFAAMHNSHSMIW